MAILAAGLLAGPASACGQGFTATQSQLLGFDTATVPGAVSGASVQGQVMLPRVAVTSVSVGWPDPYAGMVPAQPFVILPDETPDPAQPRPFGPNAPRRLRPPDPARAERLAVLGDRFFRAGDAPRAEARYQQALDADPTSGRVRVRLAQLACERGQYARAAAWLHEARAVNPRWLRSPLDVQTLYTEPRAFLARITRLETHLQAHPDDHDAWLVLGVMLHLSGRREAAADIFLRLADPDRPPDPTIASLLDASRPAPPADPADPPGQP